MLYVAWHATKLIQWWSSCLIVLKFSLWGGCLAKQQPLSLTSRSLFHITKNPTWHCMRRAMRLLTCSNVLALSQLRKFLNDGSRKTDELGVVDVCVIWSKFHVILHGLPANCSYTLKKKNDFCFVTILSNPSIGGAILQREQGICNWLKQSKELPSNNHYRIALLGGNLLRPFLPPNPLS